MNLARAEAILASDCRLKPRPLHDERYELTYEGRCGRQIALNRKDSKTAIRLWIEGLIDPRHIGLSERANIKHYEANKRRAHLSASRLTGPYDGRKGNAANYIALRDESDLIRLLDAYLADH